MPITLKKKKKCLLGLVGLYRTFEHTKNNILRNIIDNNKEKYDFVIVINTDLKNEDLIKKHPRSKEHKNIFYNKDMLEKKLRYCYNRDNQLKNIIYFSNENKKADGMFYKRVKQILDKERLEEEFYNDEYDIYIFIRLDVVVNKKINLDEFKEKHFNIITGGIKCETRYDHHLDTDFLWIFDKYSMYYFFYGNINKNYVNVQDIIKLSKINGVKSKYVELVKKNKNLEIELPKTSEFVLGMWNKYLYLHSNNIIVSFNSEKKGLYSKIIRNYELKMLSKYL